MNIALIRKLTETGIIHKNTEIEAVYKGVDLSGAPLARGVGTFTLVGLKVYEKAGRVQFDTISTIDGSPRVIMGDQVRKIDGMTLQTIGSIYGMDTFGEAVPQGKRRGRKPGTGVKKKVPEPMLNEDGTPMAPRRRGRPPGSKNKKAVA